MTHTEEGGLSLKEKGRKNLGQILFSRMVLIVVLLILQLLALIAIFRWFSGFLPHICGGTMIFTAGMVLYLLNSRIDPTAKITWLVVVMLMPVFGALLYCYTQSDLGHRALKNRLAELVSQTKDRLPRSETADRALAQADPGAAGLARYIGDVGCFPASDRTKVTYFPLGEDKWAAMLRELETAERFIFLEYFIVSEGVMWGKVLEILARKAKEGVDVRLMYDGTCELSTMPHDYPEKLKALGIQCKVFAPLSPFVSTYYNYRDHRKILVIDGRVAFNGGVNLADEYINRRERFGHWKDTAVMLEGEAVSSFTLMFLQMWSIDDRNPVFDRFLTPPANLPEPTGGFVIPYGDSPLDGHKVGERVYMDILNRAQRYVHIMSPYLILDGEMETALRFAAERGVDVTLILPGIPDKPMPYALAKTHYASLLSAGVHIFEYTPGFVHAKVFVADDREAVVGTINLDYRSLYHHFECATYLNRVDCIPAIEADFQATLAQCRRVTPETVRQEKWTTKAVGFVLKVVAPLL